SEVCRCVGQVRMVILATADIGLVKAVRRKLEIDPSVSPRHKPGTRVFWIETVKQDLEGLHIQRVVVATLLDFAGGVVEPVMDDLGLRLAKIHRAYKLPESP